MIKNIIKNIFEFMIGGTVGISIMYLLYVAPVL